MKFKFVYIIPILLGLASWFILISFIFPGVGPACNMMEVITTFLTKHWISVSLIISEIAAFLPAPWNGIIASTLKIVSKVFFKNSKS